MTIQAKQPAIQGQPGARFNVENLSFDFLLEGRLCWGDIWNKIVSISRRRRIGNIAGDVALDGVVDDLALAEPSAESQKYVEIAGGRRLQVMSFFDTPDNREISDAVDHGQREAYIRHKIWRPDVSGAFTHGKNVEIIAFLDPKTSKPVASMRKYHLDTDKGNFLDFPSAKKCQEVGAFNPGQPEGFLSYAGNRPIVEIMSLWKAPGYGSDVTVALYREAFHQSLERNELWFMGVVPAEKKALLKAYGSRVIKTIGSPANVHDGAAAEGTTVQAVYADPANFFADMIRGISDDREAAARLSAEDDAHRQEYSALITRAAYREVLMWRFYRGLDPTSLQDPVLQQLKEFSNGGN